MTRWAVWDLRERKVIQSGDLGKRSGALMVHFVMQPGVRQAFINAPGTSAIWLADDDDGDGVFDGEQVLGPEDGLALPLDMLLSHDGKSMYVSNWFGNSAQKFDVSDPFEPALEDAVSVPHPNMLRLSRDNRRLYVTNSLLTPWDNDPDFGPARNDDYGIWLFEVDEHAGSLTPSKSGGDPWVSFEERPQEDHHRPGGATHGPLRPEHPARARRALRKDPAGQSTGGPPTTCSRRPRERREQGPAGGARPGAWHSLTGEHTGEAKTPANKRLSDGLENRRNPVAPIKGRELLRSGLLLLERTARSLSQAAPSSRRSKTRRIGCSRSWAIANLSAGPRDLRHRRLQPVVQVDAG